MALSLRKKVNIKVRQPLQKILLPVVDAKFKKQVLSVQDLIIAEVNVEEIEFLEDATTVLVKKIKPNFKALGPKVGGLMKQLSASVSDINQEQIAHLEKKGMLPLNLGAVVFDLLLEDVEILSEDIPGWQVANQGKLTVALDITLTDALKEKGLARELVNRIQNIRKDKGFEITDRINVKIKGPEEVQRSINNNFDYIRSEILAIQLELVEQLEGSDVISLEMDEALQVLTSVNKN